MKFQYNYTYGNAFGSWELVVHVKPDTENAVVTVTKDGIKRQYEIREKILFVKQENEYVSIDVVGNKTYQFKFEEGNFLVGDIFNTKTGEMVYEFASYVFGEDEIEEDEE